MLHKNIFNQDPEIPGIMDRNGIATVNELIPVVIRQDFRKRKIKLPIKQTEVQLIIQHFLYLSVIQCRCNFHCNAIGDIIPYIRYSLLEKIPAEIVNRELPVMYQKIKIITKNLCQGLPVGIPEYLNKHPGPGALEYLSHLYCQE